MSNGVLSGNLMEDQHIRVDSIGLMVVGQGMGVVGVPVGMGQFKRNFLQEAVKRKNQLGYV